MRVAYKYWHILFLLFRQWCLMKIGKTRDQMAGTASQGSVSGSSLFLNPSTCCPTTSDASVASQFPPECHVPSTPLRSAGSGFPCPTSFFPNVFMLLPSPAT